MDRWGTVLAPIVVAVALAVASAAWADDKDVAAPPAAGGMRVYIDPETGEFGAPPPETTGAATSAQRARPTDDLVEEANPAGGYSVDLKRRFGGVARAVAGANGVEVECEDGTPGGER
jgi:hypothetical protein